MNILVAGSNGKTGRLIVNLLLEDDHNVHALIRKPEQAAEFEKMGAIPVLGDLESDISFVTEDCDTVIFAAGSGSGNGPEKTTTVDEEGAKKLVDSAVKNGAKRFIMLSSLGADDPESGGEKMEHYLTAKANADDYLIKSGLNYTIVRPGQLTDNESSDKIRVAKSLPAKNGDISRLDVAKTITASIDNAHTYRKVFELLSGNDEVEEALNRL